MRSRYDDDRGTGSRLRTAPPPGVLPQMPIDQARWGEVLEELLLPNNLAHGSKAKGVSRKTIVERRAFQHAFFREPRGAGWTAGVPRTRPTSIARVNGQSRCQAARAGQSPPRQPTAMTRRSWSMRATPAWPSVLTSAAQGPTRHWRRSTRMTSAQACSRVCAALLASAATPLAEERSPTAMPVDGGCRE